MDIKRIAQLAGVKLAKPTITESIKKDQVIQIVQALKGLTDDNLEIIYGPNDDDEEIKGPDGADGWFNNGSTAHKVEKFDASTVRAVVNMMAFCQAVREGQVRDLRNEELDIMEALAAKF